MAAGENFFDSPCTGYKQPGLSWSAWRNQVFAANTGCDSQGNCPDSADADTFYRTKKIFGQYYNVLQPVTLRKLYSYSDPCKQFSSHQFAKDFCDNLYYLNGDVVPPDKRPYPCGGNGPNISDYHPYSYALEEMMPELNSMAYKLEETAEVAAKRIQSAWLILLVVIVALVILRFF